MEGEEISFCSKQLISFAHKERHYWKIFHIVYSFSYYLQYMGSVSFNAVIELFSAANELYP